MIHIHQLGMTNYGDRLQTVILRKATLLLVVLRREVVGEVGGYGKDKVGVCQVALLGLVDAGEDIVAASALSSYTMAVTTWRPRSNCWQ